MTAARSRTKNGNAVWRTGTEYIDDLRDLGVTSPITCAISSVDTGVRKPDPEFFRIAATLVGSVPSESVVIGNLEENHVLPARSLGAYTIRIALDGRRPRESVADAFVCSLADASMIALERLACR